ncbi:hypothetical protein HYY75_08630 [bacterium]|nr:hypothetical protein [bacterium]
MKVSEGEFRPFGHPMLRFRFVNFLDYLQTSGSYDPDSGRLNLRGIVLIQDENGSMVELGKGKPITFTGKGVLIAYGGFKISSGIKKNPSAAPDDVCVLYSLNGLTIIDTSDEIEAFIISTNPKLTDRTEPGVVEIKKPLKLFGGLAVDRLEVNNWVAGEHSIKYNPVLPPNVDAIYQIIPSPQISFQRTLESEN